jgi:hypothetical protein
MNNLLSPNRILDSPEANLQRINSFKPSIDSHDNDDGSQIEPAAYFGQT